MKYLLDTTVISDFTRGHPAVMARLKALSHREAGISSVTTMEIEYGLRLNSARAQRISPMIEGLLEGLEVIPYGSAEARVTAVIRAALTARGQPIGPYDALIGATAWCHGWVLVTSNASEFKRIEGLWVEDWREAPLSSD